ncbi:hypothetical protein [Pimelobacter simplex]|uniref:hypothetical protein n=1 Tax=Nocardioides simplex TaxID=2045 RepID=UPI0027DD2B44
MPWTWPRLRSTIVALELPEGQYVVGLAGAMLANDSVERTAEVVLLATDRLREELANGGWPYSPHRGGLTSPGEPGLVVVGGDVSDTYTAPIAGLIAGAWHHDGVPVVSVMQVDRPALQEFLAQAAVATAPDPGALTWTWPRLRDAVTALALPRDAYVVGVAGALLANDSLSGVDEIELLVTEELRDDLVRDGWPVDTEGVLWCPTEDDLRARADGVGDSYRLGVTDLVADAWSRDDVPLVSMVQVLPDALDAVLRPGR